MWLWGGVGAWAEPLMSSWGWGRWQEGGRAVPREGRDLGVAFQAPPGSQASSRGEAHTHTHTHTYTHTHTHTYLLFGH